MQLKLMFFRHLACDVEVTAHTLANI